MSRRQVRHVEDFASRLNAVIAAREDKTLTSEWIARQIDVTLRTVQRWRGGEGRPHGAALIRLARLLDVDPASLYAEPEDVAA